MTEQIPELSCLDLGIAATEYGLIVQEGKELSGCWEDFEGYAQRLQAVAKGLHYCLGDFLNLAELRWGEDYAQLAESTGLDIQTLYNDKYVCDRIPYAWRRYAKSFEHAKAVAGIQDDEQRKAALRYADDEGLTRDELRDYAKQIKGEEPIPQWSPEPVESKSTEMDLVLADKDMSLLQRFEHVLKATRDWLGQMALDLSNAGEEVVAEDVRVLRTAMDDLLDKLKGEQ